MKLKKTKHDPTERQLRVLDRIGVGERPTTRTKAQALIDAHYRPKSKRTRQRPTQKTAAARRRGTKASARYWLTPKVWDKSCSHCGADGSVAVRPVGLRYACEGCVERLGIKAKESSAWRDGGSRAGPAVTIRKASR